MFFWCMFNNHFFHKQEAGWVLFKLNFKKFFVIHVLFLFKQDFQFSDEV